MSPSDEENVKTEAPSTTVSKPQPNLDSEQDAILEDAFGKEEDKRVVKSESEQQAQEVLKDEDTMDEAPKTDGGAPPDMQNAGTVTSGMPDSNLGPEDAPAEAQNGDSARIEDEDEIQATQAELKPIHASPDDPPGAPRAKRRVSMTGDGQAADVVVALRFSQEDVEDTDQEAEARGTVREREDAEGQGAEKYRRVDEAGE